MKDSAPQRLKRLLAAAKEAVEQGEEGGFISLALFPEDARFLAARLARYFEGKSLDKAFGVIAERPSRKKGRTLHQDAMVEVTLLRAKSPPTSFKEIARVVNWVGGVDNLRQAFRRYRENAEIELSRRHLAKIPFSRAPNIDLLPAAMKERARHVTERVQSRRRRTHKLV